MKILLKMLSAILQKKYSDNNYICTLIYGILNSSSCQKTNCKGFTVQPGLLKNKCDSSDCTPVCYLQSKEAIFVKLVFNNPEKHSELSQQRVEKDRLNSHSVSISCFLLINQLLKIINIPFKMLFFVPLYNNHQTFLKKCSG